MNADDHTIRKEAGARYDPVRKAQETAELVCGGDLRAFYRFRPARFYGGIATADCLGCCLRTVPSSFRAHHRGLAGCAVSLQRHPC
jgi:uncharacterized Fe-S cluster-containing radical SAM superfamily protein